MYIFLFIHNFNLSDQPTEIPSILISSLQPDHITELELKLWAAIKRKEISKLYFSPLEKKQFNWRREYLQEANCYHGEILKASKSSMPTLRQSGTAALSPHKRSFQPDTFKCKNQKVHIQQHVYLVSTHIYKKWD